MRMVYLPFGKNGSIVRTLALSWVQLLRSKFILYYLFVCFKICIVDGVTVVILLLLFRYFASEEFKTGVPTPGWLRNSTFCINLFTLQLAIVCCKSSC